MEQGNDGSTESDSILRQSLPLIEKINRARLELLDLSTRNRLLNTPRSGKAKTIEVVDELASAMYKILVNDGKRFTFTPGRTDSTEETAEIGGVEDVPLEQAEENSELLGQPELELDETGRVLKHWDSNLSTRMTSLGLQKRLLDLYIDAKTLLEEQGVNILYLAIGYLRWRDTSTPDTDRYAPLILVPVALERSNAGEKFHLRWSGDDIQANLSLQAFFQRAYALRLPDIVDFENLDIDAYLGSVASMVEGKPNWEVLPNDAVLGLFSFAKFMMYRDLDPQQWQDIGGLEALPALRNVVSDGFPQSSLSDDDANIDPIIPPADMLHVVDCDSSQSLVVFDVRAGTSMLVQGPPGTGKSQTIANIIAVAIHDKKKVLFVAEKMAALEVVKRRLDNIGVGIACLELHSNKANKRSLLEELKRTWQLGNPVGGDDDTLIDQLTEVRDELNDHVQRLHHVHAPSQLTPFQVLGHLVRLRRRGLSIQQFPLEGATGWAPHEKEARFSLIQDISERITQMGRPVDHAWFGVGNVRFSPNDRDRLLETVAVLGQDLAQWREGAANLCESLDLEPFCFFPDVEKATKRAERLVAAPKIGSDAFLSQVWEQQRDASEIISSVRRIQNLREQIKAFASTDALATDWKSVQASLSELPPGFKQDGELASIEQLDGLLKRGHADMTRLAQILNEPAPFTLDSVQKLLAVAERASTMPAMEKDALVARIWDHGVDSVDGLVDAVLKIQDARKTLAPVFREIAWSRDLEEARGHLAALGGSWFRFLNGNWRRSNAFVKSLLVAPTKLPRDEVLLIIDQLIDAQEAQKQISARDAQGQEAFGSNWEREKSNVDFLRSVVQWMRTLRPLGQNARQRLAELRDRELATELNRRLRPTVKEIEAKLVPLSETMIAAERTPWGEETLVRRVDLHEVESKVAAWSTAAHLVQAIAVQKDQIVEGLLTRIDVVMQAQQAVAHLEGLTDAGRVAFGPMWNGADSQVEELHRAQAWIIANYDLRGLAAKTHDAPILLVQANECASEAKRLGETLDGLFARLLFKGSNLVSDTSGQTLLAKLAEQLDRWKADPEGLPEWVAYMARADIATTKGLSALVNAMAAGQLLPDQATAVFDLAYFEAILAVMVFADPELAKFDGRKHSQRVEAFSRLDLNRIQRARRQVMQAHHAQLPQGGGATGPTGILRGEMEKRRGHMAIRQLMKRCAPAVQALKPVFMMSPLSVAQFLPPGMIEFDLLVVDEASQVQPVDALGAIARAKQIVVVGDERQLPPTRFFARILQDGQDDEDGSASAADVESILGLCRARGLPQRMLRWHYRSRHQSLIAVSNSQFYDNKLFIVPSPYTSEAGMGLRFHHLPESVYDRGNTRINLIEAKTVAIAVIEHAKSTPDYSLGVATFSTQQRRAIMDELELLRRLHPETEGFFAGRPDEPFFVKSLESIQGDERDVIYISVGYGRDAHGHMTMNFGPLSKDGGERRLNVLISRAKRRCEVFSSITDEDIDLERATGRGVIAFKLFMHYARTGSMTIVGQADRGKQSVFELQVSEALKERGYNVHERVGIAGFFVDLAIADPERPGRYVLGIECDGVSYSASRSARDRDRLRQSVLEEQGWIVHRIWSSDWFHRPQSELDRLVKAIEHAKIEVDARAEKGDSSIRAVPVDVQTVERGDFVEVGLVGVEAAPSDEVYAEAKFWVPSNQYELHQVPSGLLASFVKKVVEVEGPIHRSEVVARIRTLWNLQRAGGRIQAAVDLGIERAISQKLIEVSDRDFVSIPGQTVRVRDRSGVQSFTLRRPEYLPPKEIDAALLALVKTNLGATLDELILHVSRQFGYRSTSAQLKVIIEDRVNRASETGLLQKRDDLFVAPKE